MKNVIRLAVSLSAIAMLPMSASAKFLTSDPVGFAEGGPTYFNRYAYTGNNPVNFSDPTGMARVCADRSGSRIQSCVDVDGNGDGDTSDDDLTRTQQRQFSRDFGDFIRGNNGRDISLSGLRVSDYGGRLTGEQASSLRVTSQFAGAALSDAGHMGFSGTDAIRITGNTGYPFFSDPQSYSRFSHFLGGRRQVFAEASIVWPGRGVAPSLYNSPSNLARVLIHEQGHASRNFGPTFPSQHQALDAWARNLLKSSGLGGGGCAATNGFPGC